ncbi:MAG TPA: VWA domain-containing protein [Myxococcaceae bacterium]|nr:VWA domain-containing protein [Myxococcaceae bacterium]
MVFRELFLNAHRPAIALLGVMSLVVNLVAAQAQAQAPSSEKEAQAQAQAPSSEAQAQAQAQAPSSEKEAPALLLILDASGSMKADDGSGRVKIAASKEALNQMVDALPDGAPVGLRVYGHRVSNAAKDKAEGCLDTELIVPVQALDRRAMKSAIARVQARGWTPVGSSLRAAEKDLPASGARTVVLVSDGIDSCAPPDPCDVARELARRGTDLKVHTIGFQIDGQARAQLQCIAEATGGTYQDAPDAAALSSQLKQLSTRAMRAFAAEGKPVSGGSSFRDAPKLESGLYKDTIMPGEELWYAVDLKAGQQLVMKATLDRKSDKGGGGLFEVKLVNPALKGLSSGDGADPRGYEVNIRERVVSVGVQSGTIANKEQYKTVNEPGTYYARIEWKADVAPIEAPLELSVEITGDKKGADASVTPAATKPPAAQAASVTPAATAPPAGQQGETGQGASRSNRLLLLSVAGLGLLVVILGALLVYALRRKQGQARVAGMDQNRAEPPPVR